MSGSNSLAGASRPVTEVEGSLNRIADLQGRNHARIEQLLEKGNSILALALRGEIPTTAEKAVGAGARDIGAVPPTDLLRKLDDTCRREQSTADLLERLDALFDRVVL
ncbi:MAG: hypothetical protein ACREO0_08820 [Pseudoxanthomonas sp.]